MIKVGKSIHHIWVNLRNVSIMEMSMNLENYHRFGHLILISVKVQTKNKKFVRRCIIFTQFTEIVACSVYSFYNYFLLLLPLLLLLLLKQ